MYRCDAWKTIFSNGSDDTRYGAHLLFCPAIPGRADTEAAAAVRSAARALLAAAHRPPLPAVRPAPRTPARKPPELKKAAFFGGARYVAEGGETGFQFNPEIVAMLNPRQRRLLGEHPHYGYD